MSFLSMPPREGEVTPMSSPATDLPILYVHGLAVGGIEVAATSAQRRHGLLGRDGIDVAMWLRPARQVHSFAMRFPIDVIYCDGGLAVEWLGTLRPNRMGPLRWRARSVIETEQGRIAEWGIALGDVLEIRPRGDGPKIAPPLHPPLDPPHR